MTENLQDWFYLKITELSIENKNDCYYIDIIFSLDKKSEYYQEFFFLSQEYISLKTWVFKKEDYQKYLDDILVFDKESYIESLYEDIKTKDELCEISLPPSPYTDLLKQRINKTGEYIELQNNPLFTLDEKTNYFIFDEIISVNPITDTLVKELEKLKQQDKVKSLNLFWD